MRCCNGTCGGSAEVDQCGECGGNGFDCKGKCNEYVELWGECYSIKKTKEIDMSSEGLTGQIPAEIGKLVNLTSINLYDNALSGTIPVEIEKLVKLKSLFLNQNRLTGNIPSVVGKLLNLQNLYLNDNKFSGAVPMDVFQLPKLDMLFLNDNQLTGSMHTDVCYINAMVDNNKFCPPYPDCDGDKVTTVDDQNTSNCK